MIDPRPLSVLFLCTGNSARSIMAEAILSATAGNRFNAYSAGSRPKGRVHPQALKLLDSSGHPIAHLRSKSWDEFSVPGAPDMDLIITVCDDAAGEICPIWPGRPISAHWGMPDPAAVEGSEVDVALAFADTYRMLHRRIALLVSLRIDALSRQTVRRRVEEIGLDPAVPIA